MITTLISMIAARDALLLHFIEQSAGKEVREQYDKLLKSMDMQIELFGGAA